MKAMAVRPELRWKNVSDFKAALHGKQSSRSGYQPTFYTEPSSSSRTEIRARKAREKKNNHLWILPAAVLLVGIAVFTVLQKPGWLIPGAATETWVPTNTPEPSQTGEPGTGSEIDAEQTRAVQSAAIETMDALQTGEAFTILQSEAEKTQEAEYQIMTAAAQIMIAGAESATQEAEVRMTENAVLQMTQEAEALQQTAEAQKTAYAAQIKETEAAVRETHEALAAAQAALEAASALATREAENLMTETAEFVMTQEVLASRTAQAKQTASALATQEAALTQTAEVHTQETMSARQTETARPTATNTLTPTPSATATPEYTQTPSLTPLPTETPGPTVPPVILPKKFDVGDEFTFGSYEQDADFDNGPEPIEWQVLDVQGSKILLISKYGLDAIPFSSDPRSTWDTSTLKKWLNSTFYETAFTANEKSYIDDSPAGDLFLLSTDELQQYIPRVRSRIGVSTPYAKAQAHRQYDNQIWWLRTVLDDPAGSAGYVDESGEIKYAADKNLSFVVVRPCFRLNLRTEQK